jgi:hypothetical protein
MGRSRGSRLKGLSPDERAKSNKKFNTKINGERLAMPWVLVVVLVIAFGNVQGAMPALLAGCDRRHQINDIE